MTDIDLISDYIKNKKYNNILSDFNLEKLNDDYYNNAPHNIYSAFELTFIINARIEIMFHTNKTLFDDEINVCKKLYGKFDLLYNYLNKLGLSNPFFNLNKSKQEWFETRQLTQHIIKFHNFTYMGFPGECAFFMTKNVKEMSLKWLLIAFYARLIYFCKAETNMHMIDASIFLNPDNYVYKHHYNSIVTDVLPYFLARSKNIYNKLYFLCEMNCIFKDNNYYYKKEPTIEIKTEYNSNKKRYAPDDFEENHIKISSLNKNISKTSNQSNPSNSSNPSNPFEKLVYQNVDLNSDVNSNCLFDICLFSDLLNLLGYKLELKLYILTKLNDKNNEHILDKIIFYHKILYKFYQFISKSEFSKSENCNAFRSFINDPKLKQININSLTDLQLIERFSFHLNKILYNLFESLNINKCIDQKKILPLSDYERNDKNSNIDIKKYSAAFLYFYTDILPHFYTLKDSHVVLVIFEKYNIDNINNLNNLDCVLDNNITEPNQLQQSYNDITEPNQSQQSYNNITEPNQLDEKYNNITEPNQLDEKYNDITEPNQLQQSYNDITEPNQLDEKYNNITEPNQLDEKYNDITEPNQLDEKYININGVLIKFYNNDINTNLKIYNINYKNKKNDSNLYYICDGNLIKINEINPDDLGNNDKILFDENGNTVKEFKHNDSYSNGTNKYIIVNGQMVSYDETKHTNKMLKLFDCICRICCNCTNNNTNNDTYINCDGYLVPFINNDDSDDFKKSLVLYDSQGKIVSNKLSKIFDTNDLTKKYMLRDGILYPNISNNKFLKLYNCYGQNNIE